MNSPDKQRPSLTPSRPLSSKETSRVITSAESPKPHLGWYSRGYLPHWDHPGMIQSLNFRLGDSLPASVLEKWTSELGINRRDAGAPGSAAVPAASSKTESDTAHSVELRHRIEKYLDAGHGKGWLRRPGIAQLTENALRHFDGQRYHLLAWCVMPNHVHALIETRGAFPLGDILHTWKSFTSHEANKLLQRDGEFWQREYLDRYVRNAEHYEDIIAYIEENPVKAGLARIKTEWPWSSARFRIPPGSATVPAAI